MAQRLAGNGEGGDWQPYAQYAGNMGKPCWPPRPARSNHHLPAPMAAENL
jgi:hypothetical protein